MKNTLGGQFYFFWHVAEAQQGLAHIHPNAGAKSNSWVPYPYLLVSFEETRWEGEHYCCDRIFLLHQGTASVLPQDPQRIGLQPLRSDPSRHPSTR
jgi:hypothetical protein